MGTNEYSQPASKSSWDSQDFGDVNMVVKMAHFHKSSRPQWVKYLFDNFGIRQVLKSFQIWQGIYMTIYTRRHLATLSNNDNIALLQ